MCDSPVRRTGIPASLVIKIVNSILSKALYYRQFKEFLSEMETQYFDLLLHNEVRWLSKEDIQSGKLLNFQFLKQYRDKTSATVDMNYFSTVIKKIKDQFADRYEQFKTNKTTLAFIVNPLNTNSNEIHIEPFGIDTGSLEMQMIDLKSKALWRGKFTELKSKLEELEVQKCMYVTQQKLSALKEMPRVEALIYSTLGIVFQIATVK
ncbi:general transcription factor II-I repeat domain-containing protein 2A [Trichonephila clavipes]|nr:general transcription factor II-I repeat domain-containing protein 2A [Trichonephila clavipes]